MLKNKTILVGVSGGIAAYKTCEIVSQLKKHGAQVWVVMTKSAQKLVQPLTFRTLSQNPVILDLFSDEMALSPVPHIALTQQADLFLVAPATANIIGKAAQGLADDALSTMLLSAQCPIIFAPAMNCAMWQKPALKENLQTLKKRGAQIIDPEKGYLACGDWGEGRLAKTEKILEAVFEKLAIKQDLQQKEILITAGPTREMLDPIRFLSNLSSGKMGYALAQAALSRGAKVTLISGPTSLFPPQGAVFIPVVNAKEMEKAVGQNFKHCDVLIMAAAVADFTFEGQKKEKIKKASAKTTLKLVPTTDILGTISKNKGTRKIIGFAAESEKLETYAKEKLMLKKLDLIVGNYIQDSIGKDTNKAVLFFKQKKKEVLPEMSKEALAHRVLKALASREI